MKKHFGKPKNTGLDNLQHQRLRAIRQIDQVIDKQNRPNFSVKDLKQGSIISFGGQTFLVKVVAIYQESNSSFTKKKKYCSTEFTLFCLENAEVSYLEWAEEDGKLEVFYTTAELSFHAIQDEVGSGVDEDDLDQIVDDGDSIFVNGQKFKYDDDWPAIYSASDQEVEETVYLYEFKAKDGTYLTMEEWDSGSGEEDYQLWLSKETDPFSIEIISLGA